MPIRTNRGRAAVYRKLWGWPMRSPRHLIISACVALIFITAAGIVIPKLTGKADRAAAESTRSNVRPTPVTRLSTPGAAPAPTAAPTSLPTRLTSPPPPPSSAPAAPQALDTATRWAHAWVDHPEGTSVEQWLNRLRPHTTEEYLAVMAKVDPANVPATKVTGPPVAKLSFEKSVEAEVPTDGGVLRITVIRTDQGWRVANYERGD
ncbi:FIG01033472: hypothetical protein [Alloactinosynnema sp. L-07]|uniref:hypothetical protein n=1 Tax=Alloactinosynnema sp. L-07 TaxID=1653480 RepID=UPI00065F061E|nr:hypothetical protein [Alloactinosynnema sp. L-07]CRK61837.1 FIG01033472: hypothetical protein [Alloactinosynnema sp. L-07]